MFFQLFRRVEKALELDHCAVPHMDVKGTTSAIDVTQAYYQVTWYEYMYIRFSTILLKFVEQLVLIDGYFCRYGTVSHKIFELSLLHNSISNVIFIVSQKDFE